MEYSDINESSPRRFSVLQLTSAVLITALITFAVVFHTRPAVPANSYHTPALLSPIGVTHTKVDPIDTHPVAHAHDSAVAAPHSISRHYDHQQPSSRIPMDQAVSYDRFEHPQEFHAHSSHFSNRAPRFSGERVAMYGPKPIAYTSPYMAHSARPPVEYEERHTVYRDNFHAPVYAERPSAHADNFYSRMHGESSMEMNTHMPVDTTVRVRSTNICAKVIESSPACVGMFNVEKTTESVYRQCEKGKIATTCSCAAPGGGDAIEVTEHFIRGFLCKCTFVKSELKPKAFWTMRLGCKLKTEE